MHLPAEGYMLARKSHRGEDPGFRHRGPTIVRCSIGQRRHFHLTPKGKESHPRHAATKREKGSTWSRGSINQVAFDHMYRNITYKVEITTYSQ